MKLKFPKVLVIDDDETFGDALSRWLSELGCLPSLATSGAQGVALLEQGGIDVLLLDLGLPDLPGHAIIRQLKSSGSAVQVIVISGTTDMNDVVRAWRENAVDFLRKPFRIEDLSTALDKALQRGHSANEPSGQRRDAAPGPGVAGPAASPLPPPAAAAEALAALPGVPEGSLRLAVVKLVDSLKVGNVRLPILDPRVARLPEFLTTDEWSIDDLADTVTCDSNLAAGVLRAANSAAFSRGKEITSVRQACARLGSKTIVAIAFEITVKGQFVAQQEPYKTALKNAWHNAVMASRVAPFLGELLQSGDRDELRLLTLFHNVGELLSLCLFSDPASFPTANVTLAQLAVEVEALHEDLGTALTTSWKLPSSVIRLAGHHHRPARQPEPMDQKLLRNVVLASWSIALQGGFTYLPGQENVMLGRFLEVLGLSETQIEPLRQRLKTWSIEA